jgi:hypothetical protein
MAHQRHHDARDGRQIANQGRQEGHWMPLRASVAKIMRNRRFGFLAEPAIVLPIEAVPFFAEAGL